MPNVSTTFLHNQTRLNILNSLELLDTPTEEAFDRLTRLASRMIGAPVSLVSIVDSDRQFFKSMVGLAEPWASQRETPLSHSFCQHVAANNEPLIISDARKSPLVKDNLAIRDLDVIAYLGMPLTTTDGHGLGSFCVIDSKPRVWTQDEIELLRDLAVSVMVEIELRAEIRSRQEAEYNMQMAYSLIEQRNQQMSRLTEFCRSTIDTMLETVQRGAAKPELLQYLDQAQRELKRSVS